VRGWNFTDHKTPNYTSQSGIKQATEHIKVFMKVVKDIWRDVE